MYDCYLSENQKKEMERELTLSEYIDELDISEDVLEDNVLGLQKQIILVYVG